MNIRDLCMLYDYHYWATQQILAASARVSAEQFIASTTHCYGSLRGALVHTLEAECAWRNLCQHRNLAAFEALYEGAFPTVDALAQRWGEEERATRGYLATLTDDDLSQCIRYTGDGGQTRERVLWHCLLHVVNHGTQHRSEAAAILTAYGCSPGELDFTVFLDKQR